jgi:hypothetical protein
MVVNIIRNSPRISFLEEPSIASIYHLYLMIDCWIARARAACLRSLLRSQASELIFLLKLEMLDLILDSGVV